LQKEQLPPDILPCSLEMWGETLGIQREFWFRAETFSGSALEKLTGQT